MKIVYSLIVIFSLWSCTDKSNQTNLAPQSKVQSQTTVAQDKEAILKVMRNQ